MMSKFDKETEPTFDFIGKTVCCYAGGELPLYVKIERIAKPVKFMFQSWKLEAVTDDSITFAGKDERGNWRLVSPRIVFVNILGVETICIRWDARLNVLPDKDINGLFLKENNRGRGYFINGQVPKLGE